MVPIRSVVSAALAGLLLVCAAHAQRDPVKVFILAGQSNMEGKAQNVLWERQAVAEKTAGFFAPFRDDKNEQWITRDDVFIKFWQRHGPLTLGYGSPKRTGLEYAFGCRIGDACEAPVLLIKTAFGGRSIQKDFRPPSAGMPSDEQLEKELADARQRVSKRNEKQKRDQPLPTMADIRGAYGKDYRNMVTEVKTTLADCGKLFPELQGLETQLCGFVWFQGWNDQYGGAELEYEQNMRHLINDLRKDLDVEALPVVIGVMGQNGKQEAKGAMLTIQQAQLAMAKVPEFRKTVRSVRTDELFDEAATEVFPGWRQHTEQWEQVGSDFPYHYLGSAIWYTRIGNALADQMLELQSR